MNTTQTTQQLPKQYRYIQGRKMAYYDEGKGDPVIFIHGNPASAYIWRNVMPYVQDLGRCIAPDLPGMGDSDKLSDPSEYTFKNNETYLNALFSELQVDKNITFVGHDWGAVLAFSWARKHPGAVKGIVYMETLTRPRTWDEVPGPARETFRKLRGDEGERMILLENSFIEFNFPRTVQRTLLPEEMDEYRRPFLKPGQDRRAMLNWARQLPIGDEPKEIIHLIQKNTSWLATTEIPKLFITANPGTLSEEERAACMLWLNQANLSVKGHHNLQEDSADEIGAGIAKWMLSIS